MPLPENSISLFGTDKDSLKEDVEDWMGNLVWDGLMDGIGFLDGLIGWLQAACENDTAAAGCLCVC
jgi:hypothetical protein